MDHETTVIPIEDHIRKRPGMYIGPTNEKGFFDLLEGVLVDFIQLHQTDKFFITIALRTGSVSISIKGQVNTEAVMDILSADYKGYMFIKALVALSLRFEAIDLKNVLAFEKGKPAPAKKTYKHNQHAQLSFCFKPDDSIFTNLNFDFHRLSEKLKQFAMLNRNLHLLVKDHRSAVLSQNYFHYPEGIKQLFEGRIDQKHSGSLFQIFIDVASAKYAYQLGISFNRALWKTETISFANEINTYEGGSLKEGTIKGIIGALKTYTARYRHRTYRFSRKKIEQALTMVLAVRGEDLQWAGCTKAKLAVPVIKRQSRKYTLTAFSKYLHENPEHAEKFIAMFDVTTYIQTERSLAHCTMACLVAQKRVLV